MLPIDCIEFMDKCRKDPKLIAARKGETGGMYPYGNHERHMGVTRCFRCYEWFWHPSGYYLGRK